MEEFLIKLNHFSAWVLLVLIVLFIVSGFGMTKQVINPVLAKYLHDKILPVPLFIFFLFHISISSSYALKRWQVFKNTKSANLYALIFGLILLIFFLWLFFF